MGGKVDPKVAFAHGYKVGVYDVVSKKYVQMTVEESIKDVIANHDGVDIGIMTSVYDESKKAFFKIFEENGYGPLLTKVGDRFQHLPSNGAYFFTMKRHG
jgi:hypothetical protein